MYKVKMKEEIHKLVFENRKWQRCLYVYSLICQKNLSVFWGETWCYVEITGSFEMLKWITFAWASVKPLEQYILILLSNTYKLLKI